MTATGPGWTEARAWLVAASKHLRKVFGYIQRDAAREAARLAKKAIRGGAVQPPSQIGPTLMKTRAYVNAIGARKSREGFWYVGLPESKRHPHSDLKFDELYQYLEFGTSRMPPRPHLRPAARKAQKKIPDILKRYKLEVL